MSGGTINFSFLVGDKVKRSEGYLATPTSENEPGEVIGMNVNREGVTYLVRWPPNMYNPRGFVRGYDADDLQEAK